MLVQWFMLIAGGIEVVFSCL